MIQDTINTNNTDIQGNPIGKNNNDIKLIVPLFLSRHLETIDNKLHLMLKLVFFRKIMLKVTINLKV